MKFARVAFTSISIKKNCMNCTIIKLPLWGSNSRRNYQQHSWWRYHDDVCSQRERCIYGHPRPNHRQLPQSWDPEICSLNLQSPWNHFFRCRAQDQERVFPRWRCWHRWTNKLHEYRDRHERRWCHSSRYQVCKLPSYWNNRPLSLVFPHLEVKLKKKYFCYFHYLRYLCYLFHFHYYRSSLILKNNKMIENNRNSAVSWINPEIQ